MKAPKIAKRFAKALLDEAQNQNLTELLLEEVQAFRKVLEENRDLVSVLNSPIIRDSKKKAIVQELVKSFNPLFARFINLVIEHKRETYLKDILDAYTYQYNEMKGIRVVEVSSAAALSDAQRKAVLAKVQDGLVGTIELKEKVDPSLLGGIVITYGDKQYNDSLSRKLSNLKREFKKNLYVSEL